MKEKTRKLTKKIHSKQNSHYFQVADMKNSGGRYGGAITAGLFLKQFIEEVREREKRKRELFFFFFFCRCKALFSLFLSLSHAPFFCPSFSL